MGGMSLRGPMPPVDLLSHPLSHGGGRPPLIAHWFSAGGKVEKKMRFLVNGEKRLASMTGANPPLLCSPCCAGWASEGPPSPGMPRATAIASLNFATMEPAFSTTTCTTTSGLAVLMAWTTKGKT